MAMNTKLDDEIKAIEETNKALRAKISEINKELYANDKKIALLHKDKWAGFDFNAANLREDAKALDEIHKASFSNDSARNAIDNFINSFGERFKRDGFFPGSFAIGIRFSLKKDEAVTDELVDSFRQLAKSTVAGRDEVIFNIFDHGLSDNGLFFLHLSGENFENAKIRQDYYHQAKFLFEGSLRDALEKISKKLWYDSEHESEWFDASNF